MPNTLNPHSSGCFCITGASSGLGRALAVALAGPGKRLILAGRDTSALRAVSVLAEEKGAFVDCVCGDLLREDDQKHLAKVMEMNLPDFVFLNAGMGSYGRFVDTPIETSIAIIDLNISAVILLANTWCSAMLAAGKKGNIVFIASAAAYVPFPGMGTYAASKAFIVSFAEALRFELRSTSIEVLTVCPGQFTTHFQQRAAGEALCAVDETAANKMASKIIKILPRNGVYIPFPWGLLLKLRYIVPKRVYMYFLEAIVVSRKDGALRSR